MTLQQTSPMLEVGGNRRQRRPHTDRSPIGIKSSHHQAL